MNAHKEIKDDLRERRRLVGVLKRSGGLEGPDAFAGDITKALAEAGLFRLRAVLIGSVAFSCRWPEYQPSASRPSSIKRSSSGKIMSTRSCGASLAP